MCILHFHIDSCLFCLHTKRICSHGKEESANSIVVYTHIVRDNTYREIIILLLDKNSLSVKYINYNDSAVTCVSY